MLGFPGVWSDHNQEKWCNANIARPSKKLLTDKNVLLCQQSQAVEQYCTAKGQM